MRRRHETTALIVLLAAILVPVPTAAQPATATDVVVVDGGQEPRRELRYSWAPDHRERLRSTVTLDIAASEGGQAVMDMVLPISMAMDARVTEVDQDGTAWIAMTFDEMVFGPPTASGGGLPDGDALAAGFDAVMTQVTPLLEATRVWQHIDDRGRIIKTNVQFPAGFPPEARQQISRTSSSVALLPAEPVGVGARWESTGTTENQGVSLSVTSTMELIAWDGDEITLAMTMRLADDLGSSNLRQGPFDEIWADGAGKYEIDLRGVFPREAAVALTMRMAGDAPDGSGRVVPVEMDMDVGMTLETTDVG